MGINLFKKESIRTAYVLLDTRKCKACWAYIQNCKQQVIGKVSLPWHKHALIANSSKCTGCLKCINECQYGAFSKIDKTLEETKKQRMNMLNKFLVNNLLVLLCIIMIFSGLTLQLGFHIGDHSNKLAAQSVQTAQVIPYEQMREIDTSKIVCGFNYPDWSAIHKYAIVCFSFLTVYHVYTHWKWYKGVFAKRLMGKNIQVITLSALFFLVAITGLVPWFFDLLGSTNILRMVFIEIHDKIALVLVVYLILHMIKRFNWYGNAYTKLKE